VARKANVPVSGHKADQPLYETPEVMRSRLPASIVVEAIKVDHWLADGDSVEALGQTVKVSHVPGHCPGSLMFYFPAAKVAFGGDALFKGSVGRTDLPGSDRATLENSIRTRFYTLPDDTTVLSGHGEATTVGEEKESNPYVRG
jgi:glyoxylase-like metal-dependent hydrolase (beta-lactamase superfamily II)